MCAERYGRRDECEGKRSSVSAVDVEREECGISHLHGMDELNSKVVLPSCRHAMCIKRVNSFDLWMLTDRRDVPDMATVTRENVRRLFIYVDKLPLVAKLVRAVCSCFLGASDDAWRQHCTAGCGLVLARDPFFSLTGNTV